VKGTDHSSRDAKATLGICGAVTLKRGLPPELCSRYWRDAHGPLVARGAEWIEQYWQHHLDRCEGGFWQPAAGVTYDCPDEDQIDGLAETTFTGEKARKSYGESTLYTALVDDEQYCFERSVMYRTAEGRSRTYFDATEDGSPNGEQRLVCLFVFVRKQDGIQIDPFRAYMGDQFAPALAENEFVRKLRLHLLEPYEKPPEDTPNVDRTWPLEKQPQAVFEIAFRDRMDLNRFFESAAYQATILGQTKHIRVMHVFPVREVYTLVYAGRPTLAGMKSYPVADAILRIGAVHRLADNDQF
jgi:hypothetical protein